MPDQIEQQSQKTCKTGILKFYEFFNAWFNLK